MTKRTPSGIAYDDTGTLEPALLFLSGWCGPRTMFEPLMASLGGFRALAVDWRGHGESEAADGDFGSAELLEDALSVLEHANLARAVPVAVSHAGWVAIELRRRLGAQRVPRLVLIDWMVLGAPPPFLDALAGMASPPTTRAVVDQLTDMWLSGLDIPALASYIDVMKASPDDMWARAAREIAAAFERFGSPLDAIAGLDPPAPTLHLYSQPRDPAYLDAQRGFADQHAWFDVEYLDAESHFPMFEVPDAMADRIKKFIHS